MQLNKEQISALEEGAAFPVTSALATQGELGQWIPFTLWRSGATELDIEDAVPTKLIPTVPPTSHRLASPLKAGAIFVTDGDVVSNQVAGHSLC